MCRARAACRWRRVSLNGSKRRRGPAIRASQGPVPRRRRAARRPVWRGEFDPATTGRRPTGCAGATRLGCAARSRGPGSTRPGSAIAGWTAAYPHWASCARIAERVISDPFSASIRGRRGSARIERSSLARSGPAGRSLATPAAEACSSEFLQRVHDGGANLRGRGPIATGDRLYVPYRTLLAPRPGRSVVRGFRIAGAASGPMLGFLAPSWVETRPRRPEGFTMTPFVGRCGPPRSRRGVPGRPAPAALVGS